MDFFVHPMSDLITKKRLHRHLGLGLEMPGRCWIDVDSWDGVLEGLSFNPFEVVKNSQSKIYWLVVEPTPLKNIRQIGFIFPK